MALLLYRTELGITLLTEYLTLLKIHLIREKNPATFNVRPGFPDGRWFSCVSLLF
jgi:hypothetical protein